MTRIRIREGYGIKLEQDRFRGEYRFDIDEATGTLSGVIFGMALVSTPCFRTVPAGARALRKALAANPALPEGLMEL